MEPYKAPGTSSFIEKVITFAALAFIVWGFLAGFRAFGAATAEQVAALTVGVHMKNGVVVSRYSPEGMKYLKAGLDGIAPEKLTVLEYKASVSPTLRLRANEPIPVGETIGMYRWGNQFATMLVTSPINSGAIVEVSDEYFSHGVIQYKLPPVFLVANSRVIGQTHQFTLQKK